MATVIETQDLGVSFGKGGSNKVFHHLNISVEEGEFVTLVGVSGAGKSTLLRVVADLIPPNDGSVKVVAEADRARRPIAMVFQAPLLMPWRTIAGNINLGLEGLNVPEQERRERVEQTLNLVGLAGYGERWPYQLSGGQRQRIGIARALAVNPDVLLMDEPFGALDAITRTTLQDELLRIWKETRKSILFVTHDIEEAVYLGDRVLLLGGKPARIVEDYPVTIDRSDRRGSEAFLRKVEEIKAGLSEAIAMTDHALEDS
ncbi:MAG: ABC transporter ATP-binding protein [Gammaproteobacteria bacterium]|nr:ABC transporter ATP-binding protein [Gammaproteobacteria bacterium]